MFESYRHGKMEQGRKGAVEEMELTGKIDWQPISSRKLVRYHSHGTGTLAESSLQELFFHSQFPQRFAFVASPGGLGLDG